MDLYRPSLKMSSQDQKYRISSLRTHQISEGSAASKMASASDWAVALGLVSTRGRLPGRKTRQQAKLIVLVLAWRLSEEWHPYQWWYCISWWIISSSSLFKERNAWGDKSLCHLNSDCWFTPCLSPSDVRAPPRRRQAELSPFGLAYADYIV